MSKRRRSVSISSYSEKRRSNSDECKPEQDLPAFDPFDESNFVEKVVGTTRAKEEEEGWHLITKASVRKREEKVLKPDRSTLGPSAREYIKDVPTVPEHGVTYEFGDKGASWRMMKLRSLKDAAREADRSVEDLALERYGTLEKYDQAREEEQELARRKDYGIGKTKPDGSLYRKRSEKSHRSDKERSSRDHEVREQAKAVAMSENGNVIQIGDLNALKARILKAQLTRHPDEKHLQLEYDTALKRYNASRTADTIVELSSMDTRGEPLAKDENEMTIEELLREEKRDTKNHMQSRRDADNIAKDAKFNDSLDYADENADRLAKRIQKKTVNLRNTQINDVQRINKILDNCPLCHKDDGEEPPIAPVISLGSRTFLSLPSAPLTKHHCLIVPTQHRYNTLECDDDELQEIRNFMKSITRMYDSLGYSPIFYENHARPGRKGHCAIESIPIPKDIIGLAPRYFEEAIVAADEEWAQHRPLIHTTGNTMTKKMSSHLPYFHVWFDLNGGMGHVIEDDRKWPKDDLFGREIIASMLRLDGIKWRRKGVWIGDANSIEEREFKKVWRRWDWTTALLVDT